MSTVFRAAAAHVLPCMEIWGGSAPPAADLSFLLPRHNAGPGRELV